MAVYTDITEEELSAFLADYDLGALKAFKGIAGGVENSNFHVETTQARFILTIYERRVRADELPYFLDLMRYLSARGFPGPVPQVDRSGTMLKTLRGKPAAMVSFLSGASVLTLTSDHCFEGGAGLAQLHEAAVGFPMSRPNTLGQSQWADMFANHADDADAFEPGLAGSILSDLEALAAGWPTNLPAGVIHADLFPDNVFFTQGRFTAAFDFYFACNDLNAYDLAISLNAWCHRPDGEINPDHARAMVAGYESRRPLSTEERASLPILARGAAMRFFLTRLIDWGSTPAGALVKPHDPMEYARRLAFHRRANGALSAYGLAPA